MTITSQSQQLSIDSGLIELYVLDCTKIGGGIFRFTANTANTTGPVTWQGLLYYSLPIASSGWEYSSDGSQKKPTLTISNVSKALLQEVINLGDIVGAKLTRNRTLTCYLDDSLTADPTQQYRPDTFVVEQKTSHTNKIITWQLCSIIDRMGIKLPRRQITKNGDSRYCAFPAVGSYRG